MVSSAFPPALSILSTTPVNVGSRLRRALESVIGLVGILCLAVAPVARAGPGLVGGAAPFSQVDESGFSQETYFRVTQIDPRLCPSPICGGVFVERVNRPKTLCADEMYAKECHAAIVDFSALGLSPEEESALHADFAAKRALARGALVLADPGAGIEVPTLVVTDAWRGVSGTQRSWGRYWGVASSGIVCITHPCPTLFGFKLNGKRVGWLHGLDLDPSGASAAEIAAAFDAVQNGPGLIAFGRISTITGPAGKGKEFRASEFYTRVEGDARQACGGLTYPPNPACEAAEFCEPPAGSCYVADLPGTCQEVPEACIEIFLPVCGCDGRTYANDCERQQAQVALDFAGPCSVLPISCGPTTCAAGTVCCNPLHGICTPPDQFCTF
jgi:hypothetical protein